MIYISHRLREVIRIADRVTVLRDGCNAGELQKSEITHDRMVNLMVGRELSQFYQRRPHSIGEILLRVEKLRTAAFPQQELNFTVRAGEILGVAGLVGSGRTEMMRTLFGIDKARGRLRLDRWTACRVACATRCDSCRDGHGAGRSKTGRVDPGNGRAA